MLIKPLEGLTQTLVVLLKFSIALSALAIAADSYDAYTYSNLPVEIDPEETFLPSDAVTMIVSLIQLLLFAITATTWLRWFYRTNKNLSALSAERMTYTPGWCVGYFFIPILCVFRPYQAMKEIWQVCHKDRFIAYTIVSWWWAVWLVSVVAGRIEFKLCMKAEDAAGYASAAIAAIMNDVIDIILNVVMLKLVARIALAYSANFCESAGSDPMAAGTSLPPPLPGTI